MRFTSNDIEIVRAGLTYLTTCERQILIYRFWEDMTIEEIAILLEMKWDEVNRSIETALKHLKQYCVGQSDFSFNDFREAA
jgi:DNA-directed RNA polymerase specialized sigma24 family protein